MMRLMDTQPISAPIDPEMLPYPSQAQILADVAAGKADLAAGRVTDGKALLAELRQMADELEAEIAAR